MFYGRKTDLLARMEIKFSFSFECTEAEPQEQAIGVSVGGKVGGKGTEKLTRCVEYPHPDLLQRFRLALIKL